MLAFYVLPIWFTWNTLAPIYLSQLPTLYLPFFDLWVAAILIISVRDLLFVKAIAE